MRGLPYIYMSDEQKPEAAYRIFPWGDDRYSVEVSIDGTNPAVVSSFKDHAAAETWIEQHKARSMIPPKRLPWRKRQTQTAT